MIDFYFRHLWIWKVQDSQIWNLCGWEGWTLKNVFEDLIMIKIHTCALCKIFSFIVEGTTWSPWSTRATGSSWPTWSRYSRHRFGFWGNWPTRERWRTWPACKCRCVNTQSRHLTRQSGLQCSLWWRTSEHLLDCRACPVYQELMAHQDRQVPKEKR